MATTQDYINQLKIDKQNLVSMLNNMGVEANDNETFTSLTPKVGTIVTDPILQDKSVEITENGTTTITADSGYDGLNNVEVTTNVAGSGGGKYAPRWIRFSGYTGTELDEEIANLDTSNMTSFYYMFSELTNITSLNLSNLNTNNVTVMMNMFYNCTGLTSLNLNNFNTSNVINMSGVFRNCSSLNELDLSGFILKPNANVNLSYLFYGCSRLQKLDIRNFEFSYLITSYSNMFNSVPANCEIIVKDDTAKNWVLARRSDFTNVKTVAELG